MVEVVFYHRETGNISRKSMESVRAAQVALIKAGFILVDANGVGVWERTEYFARIRTATETGTNKGVL